MNTLSTNLNNLLHNENISENELARRTGVAQQIINRILSGENKNPKISTLNPLANYFGVSISQLIGDEGQEDKTKLDVQLMSWQQIPIINLKSLEEQPLNDLLLQDNEKLLVDIKPFRTQIFATKMVGDSMDPKFPDGTILIFDINKKPSTGDFALLKSSNNKVEFRQIFIKNNNVHKKCMNPTHEDYNATLVINDFECLGLLIQSRTNYVFG